MSQGAESGPQPITLPVLLQDVLYNTVICLSRAVHCRYKKCYFMPSRKIFMAILWVLCVVFSQARKFLLIINLASHQEGYWWKPSKVPTSWLFSSFSSWTGSSLRIAQLFAIVVKESWVKGMQNLSLPEEMKPLLVQVRHAAEVAGGGRLSLLPMTLCTTDMVLQRQEDCRQSWPFPTLWSFFSPEVTLKPYAVSSQVFVVSEVSSYLCTDTPDPLETALI